MNVKDEKDVVAGAVEPVMVVPAPRAASARASVHLALGVTAVARWAVCAEDLLQEAVQVT